jgi:hypothetical protein
MAAEVPLDLTYAIYSLLFEGGSYDWTKLLDPWGLFGIAGRPRDEATEEVINRLESSPNAAARLWGIELARGLAQFGLVISTSGSGREILDAWASQFVANMEAQGVPLRRARAIAVNAMSHAAQQGSPLEPELQQKLSSDLTFNGPQAIADTFLKGISYWNRQGFIGSQLLLKAENYTLKNSTIPNLTKLQIGKPATDTTPVLPVQPGGTGYDPTCQPGYSYDAKTALCWPIPPVPPPGQGCPPGFHWDILQFKCVPDQPGNTPPPPTQPPGGIGPDPDGDEITSTLCAQINAATDRLISALTGTTGGSGGPVDLTPIVNAIEDAVGVLTDISNLIGGLAGGGAAPVDLSGVVNELGLLVEAVGAIAPSSPTDLTPIVDALNKIAASLGTGGSVDTASIAKALNDANVLQDVPHALVQQFFADGVLPDDFAAILQGTPASWVHSALKAAAMFSPIIGFAEHLLGDDADFKAALRADREGRKAAIAATWKILKDIPGLPPEATTNHLADIFKTYFKVSEATLGPIIKPVVDAISDTLKGTGTPALGAYPVEPDQPITDATGAALGAAVGGWLAAYAGVDEGEPLAHIAELFSGAVGFEELRDVKIGPLVRHGIGKVAEMQARAQFQQEIPGVGQTTQLLARGLLAAPLGELLLGWNGLHTSLRAQVKEAAYSGINPRQLIRLVPSGLYSEGDIVDELTFAGMRPASQQRFTRAIPWLITATERKQLEATLEKAHINGLLSDADLAQEIDGLDQNTDRNDLILKRANLEKRLAYAKELEKAYTQEFLQGVFDDPQYRSLLAGLGLQDDFINARVAADEAHMTAILTRQAAAEERALVRATAAQERRAAVKNFTTGNIDAVALTAALVLTGLTPAQAAAWVDLAVLQKSGGLHWIYGLQKSASDAALLRARVTALSDQRKRQQISDELFVADLQALGIQAPYLNSIRAAVNAMITPKADAVTIPVETK